MHKQNRENYPLGVEDQPEKTPSIVERLLLHLALVAKEQLFPSLALVP